MTTQAILIPTTLAPPSMIRASVIETDTVMYFVELNFGKTPYFPERNSAHTVWDMVIADMLDAELTDVKRIIAVDLENKGSWDATREAADEIFTRLVRSGSNIPEWLVDFLHEHIADREIAPYLRCRLAA